MRLFNQIGKTIDWHMEGRKFECEPFGQIEIPDHLVEHCKARKLPLGHTPIPPVVKAEAISAEAAAEVRADELRVTKEELALAKVEEKAAKEAVERSQIECASLRRELGESKAEVEAKVEQIRGLTEDKGAAEELLREVTAKLEDAEHQIALARRLDPPPAAEGEAAKDPASETAAASAPAPKPPKASKNS